MNPPDRNDASGPVARSAMPHGTNPPGERGAGPPRPVRVRPELELGAARRLVAGRTGDLNAAARRFLAAASAHGIDATLMWVTLGPTETGPDTVRQACLIVPGAGRTATVFVSEPPKEGDPGGAEAGREERSACIEAACRHVGGGGSGLDVKLAQALPEPGQEWAIRSFRGAGFTPIGRLLYVRRAFRAAKVLAEIPEPRFDAGQEAVTFEEWESRLGSRAGADAALVDLLDRTYEGTLDCPELCGMRETPDILASHRATGRWDGALWWILLERGEAVGCALVNVVPEQHGAELVYMGLAPGARGRGLGARLLSKAMRALAERRPGEVTELACAVDSRNGPALRVYGRAGLREFTSRMALVRRL